MAEQAGFEPAVQVYPVRQFSKLLVSATHPLLRGFVSMAPGRRIEGQIQTVPQALGARQSRIVVESRPDSVNQTPFISSSVSQIET